MDPSQESGPSGTEQETSIDSSSSVNNGSSDEFQCRPIRLGHRKRVSNPSVHLDSTLIWSSNDQLAASRHRNSSHSNSHRSSIISITDKEIEIRNSTHSAGSTGSNSMSVSNASASSPFDLSTTATASMDPHTMSSKMAFDDNLNSNTHSNMYNIDSRTLQDEDNDDIIDSYDTSSNVWEDEASHNVGKFDGLKLNDPDHIVNSSTNNNIGLDHTEDIDFSTLKSFKSRTKSKRDSGNSDAKSVAGNTHAINRSGTRSSHSSAINANLAPGGLGIRVVSTPDQVSRNVKDAIFAVCMVNFHHIRGPEVEYWKSNYINQYNTGLFKNLAFQALPDGLHLFEETFSNFSLVYDFDENESLDDGEDYNRYLSKIRNLRALKTLFGCLCIRQIKLEKLSARDRVEGNVTRLIVQKAVVVMLREPLFAHIKEKLSIVTASYFEQDDFSNHDILDSLYDLLNGTYNQFISASNSNSPRTPNTGRKSISINRTSNSTDEDFVSLDLRALILTFGTKIFTLYKALLLEKKVLVYSNSNLEELTNFQNLLISLFPGLMSNLQFLGCPLLDYTEQCGPLQRPILLDTKSKRLLLRFFGLPLQVLNTKGSFYNPYLPLQQLSELLLTTTKSCLAGCLNRLFIDQSVQLKIDVLVDLDQKTVTYPQGKPEDLTLSSLDKRFIGDMISSVKSASGSYVGSDDYIRYSFEDYLYGLVLTYRYNQYTEKFKMPPPGFNTGMPPAISDDDVETDLVHNGNLALFGRRFIESWTQTANFRIWNSTADEFIFNFLDPKHVSANLESLIQLFFLTLRKLGNQIPGAEHQVSQDKEEESNIVDIKQDPKEVHVVYNPDNSNVKLAEDTPLTRLSAWWNKKK